MSNIISDTGLSVVYVPDEGNPLLDIVIVHGLQGHPFRTWATTKTSKTAPFVNQSYPEISQDAKKGNINILRRISSKVSGKSSVKVARIEPNSITPSTENINNDLGSVFWPRDLAPKDCPRSRILVYGYDTKISKYMTGPTNKNHVLSHGKDLLFALGRGRPHDRPLVFLAHSLGGIVVKEALAASSTSAEGPLKNLVESTAGVIFLGTPHRGSSDFSYLGERARSILSAFRMETNSAMLDALGLKTSDLERAQESFSRLWHKYDFRVKTFQEGLGLTGVHLGILGGKVVPDYSSLLGDHRERAETIQANHMEMCRFTGLDDPDYRKIAGELRSINQSIQELNECQIHQNGLIQRRSLGSKVIPSNSDGIENGEDKFRDAVRPFHQKLKFTTMGHRFLRIPRAAEKTCSWLFEHENYRDWIRGQNLESHKGLLLIQGKPRAGKSVLVKEAYRRISLDQGIMSDISATFFFNARGEELDKSGTGMFRSLLYQLLPLYEEGNNDIGSYCDSGYLLSRETLQEFFENLFSKIQKRRTFIFIDGLDECAAEDVRLIAAFWRRITWRAYASGAQLNVLISMRGFPHITFSNCPVIWVDRCNQHGIDLYIQQRINLAAMPEQVTKPLKTLLVEESRGIFYWAVLMVEVMIQRWHEGEGLPALLADRTQLPRELDALYTEILGPVDARIQDITIRLFQWATLANAPLRLHEWHHILGFIRHPRLRSLHDWRTSGYFTDSDDQLERLIKSLSRGLLEVRTGSTVLDSSQDIMSTWAGAGSLDNSHGETRVVEFIHESVREFFLQGQGFFCLNRTLWRPNGAAAGHLQIMHTCLNYLDIPELDALVAARYQQARDDEAKGHRPTQASFLKISNTIVNSKTLTSIHPK